MDRIKDKKSVSCLSFYAFIYTYTWRLELVTTSQKANQEGKKPQSTIKKTLHRWPLWVAMLQRSHKPLSAAWGFGEVRSGWWHISLCTSLQLESSGEISFILLRPPFSTFHPQTCFLVWVGPVDCSLQHFVTPSTPAKDKTTVPFHKQCEMLKL